MYAFTTTLMQMHAQVTATGQLCCTIGITYTRYHKRKAVQRCNHKVRNGMQCCQVTSTATLWV